MRKMLPLLSAAMLCGALLAGCGDDEADQGQTTVPENPAADNEPNRDAPNPPDVDSGTNINTGVGNDNMPESAEDE